MPFNMPTTGGSAPASKPLPGMPGGLFAVPTGIQRIAEYALYSMCRMAAGAVVGGTVFRLFSVGQNNTGLGFANPLSISETNMQVGAIAPGNETYEVTAISAEVYSNGGAAPLTTDLRLMQRIGIFQWEFGQTTRIPISPLSMVGAGGGIFGATGDTGTPTTFANNGNGGIWSYMNVVIAIPATQAFALLLELGLAGLASGATITVIQETQIRVCLFNLSRNAVPVA